MACSRAGPPHGQLQHRHEEPDGPTPIGAADSRGKCCGAEHGGNARTGSRYHSSTGIKTKQIIYSYSAQLSLAEQSKSFNLHQLIDTLGGQ